MIAIIPEEQRETDDLQYQKKKENRISANESEKIPHCIGGL
jgi:hypothetical protein